jgi:hypothetical protein
LPKIRYQDFRFQGKNRDLIEKCNEIIAEHQIPAQWPLRSILFIDKDAAARLEGK